MVSSSEQPELVYEKPEVYVIGTVAEVTQVGGGNPKIGPHLDGNNVVGLGKTSTWPD
jgi:hypothetical protein